MSELIDYVAMSLARRDEYDDWSSLMPRTQEHYRDAARTVIEAMREPTEAMIEAGHSRSILRGGHDPAGTWQLMIDEALR